jgi:hypothetical protein
MHCSGQFTYERYPNIRFVNSRATVLVCPHRDAPISENIRRTLRATGAFPGARAEPDQRRHDAILAAVHEYMQNFEPCWFLSVSPPAARGCNISYRETTATVYHFANDYNQGCTFCMTLFSVVNSQRTIVHKM